MCESLLQLAILYLYLSVNLCYRFILLDKNNPRVPKILPNLNIAPWVSPKKRLQLNKVEFLLILRLSISAVSLFQTESNVSSYWYPSQWADSFLLMKTFHHHLGKSYMSRNNCNNSSDFTSMQSQSL